MADTAPHATSALAGRTGPIGGPHHAGVSLREVGGLALINLRGEPGAATFAAAIEKTLATAPPVVPNTVAHADGNAVLWLGPDEWLVVSENGDGTGLRSRLEAALDGQRHATVDLSDNYAVIEIAGHAARWVLAKGWPQDLHPSAFKPGQCSQGMLAHAQIILEHTGAETYRMFVRPSFSAYLWDWLVDASADVGHRIAAG